MTPVHAKSVTSSKGKTVYPEPFASLVAGRTKRKLGDLFELSNFGVNLTELEPGAISSVLHHHSKQDEFIYILQGTATLLYGSNEYCLSAGDCIGFKAGTGIGHQLVNRSEAAVVYLEVGDRSANDAASYPNDDLHARLNDDGSWIFTHKDGTLY